MQGIKIKSPNQTGWGTQVFDADTGQELKGVTDLTISIEADNYTTANVRIVAAAVDVESAVATFAVVHPVTGKVKIVRSIEFEDGTSWPSPRQSD